MKIRLRPPTSMVVGPVGDVGDWQSADAGTTHATVRRRMEKRRTVETDLPTRRL